MDSGRNQRDVSRKIFKQLSLLRAALDESSTLHLGQRDLETLGIKWSEMDLQSENENDSGVRFCSPMSSKAIDTAFDKIFVDNIYKAGQPGLAPYNLEFQGPFYSAVELGEMMRRYLGC